MASAGTVVITLDANTAKLVEGVKRTEKNIRGLKRSVTGAKKSLSNIVKYAAGFYAVGKAISFAEDQAKSFIATGAKFEQFETVLSNLEGSSQAAEKSMQWIQDFSQNTPYQIDQVTASYTKLRAYGLEPTKGLLKTLGDTAAAMSKPIMQGVEAIADAVTGENERLKEFGIKAKVTGHQIQYAWTDASNKTRQVVIDNNRKTIQSTLEAIMNSKYAGAMKDQMKTWNGIVSNIQDTWTNFQASVMKAGVLDHLKAIAMSVKGTMNDFDSGKAAAWAHTINGGIDTVIRALGVMRDGWRFFEIGGGIVKAAMLELAKIFAQVGNGLKRAYAFVTHSKADLTDLAEFDRRIAESRANYMDAIKKVNEGAGQKWAEETIANMNKLEGQMHKVSGASNDAKAKAEEMLSAISSGASTATDKLKQVEAAYKADLEAAGYSAKTAKDYYAAEVEAANAIDKVDTAQQAAAESAQRMADASRQSADAAREQAAAIAGVTEVAPGSNVWHVTPSAGMSPAQTGHSTHGAGEHGTYTDDQVMQMSTFSPFTGSRPDVAAAQARIKDKRAQESLAAWYQDQKQKEAEAAKRAAEANKEMQRRAAKAQREFEKQRAEAERKYQRERAEAMAKAEQAVKSATDALDKFGDHLASLRDGLLTDYVSRARASLYGGTSKAYSFAEATAAARTAWAAFQNDDANDTLLKAYNSRMDELIGTLDEFKDSSKYATKAQQDWAKASSMHQVRTFQSGQLRQVEVVDKQLEELKKITGHTYGTETHTSTSATLDGQIRDHTSTSATLDGQIRDHTSTSATLNALIKDYTSATKGYASTIKSYTGTTKDHTDSIKSYTGTTAGKHQSKNSGYHDEWVQTGSEVKITNSHEELWWNGHEYVTRTVYETQLAPKFGKKRMYQQLAMFQSGGFTGPGRDTDVAGIVHANEYVINAQTTRDLGLNGAQGLFSEMVKKLGGIEAAIIAVAQNTGMTAADIVKLLKHEEAKAVLGGYEEMAS